MKHFFTLLLATIAVVACTQNEVEELTVNRADVPETLTVGFECDDTRIELNGAKKTVWTKDDLVSVFYRSNANQKWQYQGETGERLGVLKRVEYGVATREMDDVVVVYPYNENYYINPNSCSIQAMLPATQHYKQDSYGYDGNIMVSCSEYNQVSLRNVCGWLKIMLTGNGEKVRSITLRGNRGEQVAGEIYINAYNATAVLASEMGSYPDEDENGTGGAGGGLQFDDSIFTELTLDCADGVELGEEATAFYIAVLPQRFSEGITVEINSVGGYETMVLSTSNEVVIERNHISPMESVEHSAEYKAEAKQILYTATSKLGKNWDNIEYFGANVISHTFDSATREGIILFDDGVTKIGNSAFSSCYSLTSVTIPDSVTTIGDGAFQSCSSLTEFKGKFAEDNGRILVVDGTLVAFAPAGLTEYAIPDSVTTIGDRAFSSCSSLTGVTIPDSVTTIGESAFSSCSSLTGVTIPDSVTTIGDYAFYSCNSLTSVTIPDSVTTIENAAFRDCGSLTSVTIGDSVTTIGNAAFYYCYSLTSVTIGDSVTTIGDYAFYSCNSLTEFKGKFAEDNGRILVVDGTLVAFAPAGLTEYAIPDSVTTIGESAFYYCSSLTSITISDSVTTIGDFAFWDCDSLTSVTIGDSVTTIGRYAFCGCDSLTSVTIGDSVTTIGERAFYHCSSLTSITIPDSVTTIGVYAFEGCSSLTSVAIPDSVTTIGDYAFEGCSSLTSVTIGDSVTTLGNAMFRDCSKLVELYCSSLTPPTIDYSIFDSSSNCYIYVPAESVDDYRADNNWSKYLDYIIAYDFENGEIAPESLSPANNEIWYTNGSTTEPTEPKYSNVFGANIVSNTYNRVKECWVIRFDGEVTQIGTSAFETRRDIRSVVLPQSVTEIGSCAFNNCFYLRSINIPDGVTSIGSWAFHYSGLKEVTIPDSVESIGGSAFVACSSLERFYGKFAADDGRCLIIGNVIKAFAHKSITGYYEIPESVNYIGDSAFESCSTLTTVVIGENVTGISSEAFFYCDNLSSVYCLATTPPSGASGMFNYNADGRKIYVPIESLDAYKAASGWSTYAADIYGVDFENSFAVNYTTTDGSIANFRIPTISNTYANGVGEVVFYGDGTAIPANAFYDCNNLLSVTIPDSVTTIESNAFSNCSSLESINIPEGVNSFGGDAFNGCSKLNRVEISDIVAYCNASFETRLANPLYYGNIYINGQEVADLVIPDDVTTIGNNAFAGSNITSVTIPDSVTTIGESAFYYCSSLTSITIPDSVTTIGNNAFYYCSNLAEVYCLAVTPPTLGSNVFYTNASGRKIYVPIEAVDEYKSSWSSYSTSIVEVPYIPTECLSLTITADDASGRSTTTTIYYTAETIGTDILGNERSVTITGTAISDEFPQNLSETESVERTISFTYLGVTATTTITQGVYVNCSYTVNLNSAWRMSTSVSNPDTSLYDGVYESYSNYNVDSGVATMYIDINGYTEFSIYVRSDAESTYDFVTVSELDSTVQKVSTSGKQSSGIAISNYTKVTYTGIDGGSHRITINYRKDSSVNRGSDRGYVLIPNNQ